MLLERHLIEYCSPTLASLKSASLFNHTVASEVEFMEQFDRLNSQLGEKGISLTILCRQQNKALIYVYRKKQLIQDLNKPGVSCFLKNYGYENLSVEAALLRLKVRLKQEKTFPHEIGIFLGYPLLDVIGFITHAGKNCICLGCWKVYCNECEAVKRFAKYKKCKDIYAKLWQNGRTVWQLTVAV
ncbi:DUF3793 family protein [Clostridium sp. E02]|uniref:DUF3793 family protein n=1 Tax=Clostridium sp. E02 TaxID=2487134 RepID=UPI000F544D8B|nr:DUF3793 family protein [Clostridium sp. E02]